MTTYTVPMKIRLLFALFVAAAGVAALIRKRQAPVLPPAESGTWSAVAAPAAR